MKIGRFVIVGAGGVGGAIGAMLFQAGRDVLLVARPGPHLDALRSEGLVFRRPSGRWLLPIPATSEYVAEPGDVVLLAVKSQDTEEAVTRAPVPGHVPVVCAQNGVDNEARVAALPGRTGVTLGMLVWLAAVYLRPGEVDLHHEGCPGILDLGPAHPVADEVAAALTAAGFDSVVRPDIAAWKHAKLISNLHGILQLTSDDPDNLDPALSAALIAEGEACYAAAGIDHVSVDELRSRCSAVSIARIDGRLRPGSSLWQSAHRGRTSELDWLNGHIARLGRAHGVPTPVHDDVIAAYRRRGGQR